MYSRVVTHLLCAEPGVELTNVVYRTPWTYRRIRQELRRDGPRLLRKVHQKLVLGDEAYRGRETDTLSEFAKKQGMTAGSLRELSKIHGFRLTRVKDHNDEQSQSVLKNAAPHVIVFTGGGLIRQRILDIPAHGVLNAHMGILPQYRGMDVVEWPILEASAGEAPQLGLTVHFMDRGVDTGPMILTRKVESILGDDIAALRLRFERQMVLGMVDAVRLIRDGKCEPRTQSAEDGKQYFLMHPRLHRHCQEKYINLMRTI